MFEANLWCLFEMYFDIWKRMVIKTIVRISDRMVFLNSKLWYSLDNLEFLSHKIIVQNKKNKWLFAWVSNHCNVNL